MDAVSVKVFWAPFLPDRTRLLNVNYISPLTTIRLPQKTNRVKKGDKAFITLKKQELDKGIVVGLGFLK